MSDEDDDLDRIDELKRENEALRSSNQKLREALTNHHLSANMDSDGLLKGCCNCYPDEFHAALAPDAQKGGGGGQGMSQETNADASASTGVPAKAPANPAAPPCDPERPYCRVCDDWMEGRETCGCDCHKPAPSDACPRCGGGVFSFPPDGQASHLCCEGCSKRVSNCSCDTGKSKRDG